MVEDEAENSHEVFPSDDKSSALPNKKCQPRRNFIVESYNITHFKPHHHTHQCLSKQFKNKSLSRKHVKQDPNPIHRYFQTQKSQETAVSIYLRAGGFKSIQRREKDLKQYPHHGE
jgi:hypothetical protein